jgi:hypothetical protein
VTGVVDGAKTSGAVASLWPRVDGGLSKQVHWSSRSKNEIAFVLASAHTRRRSREPYVELGGCRLADHPRNHFRRRPRARRLFDEGRTHGMTFSGGKVVAVFFAGAFCGTVLPAAFRGLVFGARSMPPIDCPYPARPFVLPTGRGHERQSCIVDHGTVRRFERGVVVQEDTYHCGVKVSPP